MVITKLSMHPPTTSTSTQSRPRRRPRPPVNEDPVTINPQSPVGPITNTLDLPLPSNHRVLTDAWFNQHLITSIGSDLIADLEQQACSIIQDFGTKIEAAASNRVLQRGLCHGYRLEGQWDPDTVGLILNYLIQTSCIRIHVLHDEGHLLVALSC